jgi:hypothetical protein
MNPQLYAVLEPLIVGLAVLFAAMVVLRKQAPTLWTRITGMRAGTSCHDSGDRAKGGSCSSGCGNCGQATAPATQKTVHVHPRQP